MPPDDSLRSKLAIVGPLALLGFLVLAAVGVGVLLYVQLSEPSSEVFAPEDSPEAEAPLVAELPSLVNPALLNTSPQATYVGIETCAECHDDQHESYHATAHSLALTPIDPSAEPPDAEFQHEKSGRQYRVYRDGEEFRQREFIADEEGIFIEQDYAMDWLIGSGHHSRSYLVNIDGYMVESPVTWYEQQEDWGVSPGYDAPNHWGFERSAGENCIYCHVGRATREVNSPSRLTIHEGAIGCERCHGPGSLHVERWRKSDGSLAASDLGDADGDPTIVNPARLDRRLAEDICAQCHLRGDATVTVRNRSLTDYRPGTPLHHVRVDYQLKAENRAMNVVGHMEQMRASACWKADASTLTCTTCHDPHQGELEIDKDLFYRQKCLQCHSTESCGLPTDNERRQQANDRCVECHMPQVPTDIPHIAFTHHRIAIHDSDPDPPAVISPEDAKLLPTSDLIHLEEVDRERCQGLAYFEFASKQQNPAAAKEFRERALDLLIGVHARGVADGDTDAALAMIFWEQRSEDAIHAARSALASESLSPQSRINAHFVLAEMALHEGQHLEAMEHLETLVKLRRHSQDHFLMAASYADQGRYDRALAQAESALSIHPFRRELYAFLAEVSKKAGEPEKAERYADVLRRLEAQAGG